MPEYTNPGVPGAIDIPGWVRSQIGSEDATREVLTFVRRWSELQRTILDRDPSLAEFAEHWRVPRPDAARGLGLFRVAFPREASPSTLMRTISDQVVGEQTTPFDAWVKAPSAEMMESS
jgi:hypothetical protein